MGQLNGKISDQGRPPSLQAASRAGDLSVTQLLTSGSDINTKKMKRKLPLNAFCTDQGKHCEVVYRSIAGRQGDVKLKPGLRSLQQQLENSADGLAR